MTSGEVKSSNKVYMPNKVHNNITTTKNRVYSGSISHPSVLPNLFSWSNLYRGGGNFKFTSRFNSIVFMDRFSRNCRTGTLQFTNRFNFKLPEAYRKSRGVEKKLISYRIEEESIIDEK
jgi:hypothetical protein